MASIKARVAHLVELAGLNRESLFNAIYAHSRSTMLLLLFRYPPTLVQKIGGAAIASVHDLSGGIGIAHIYAWL